ncbi:hypothetical protein CN394_14635, partial [Bacillus anthracis]
TGPTGETGATGPTGPTGATGPTPQSAFRAVNTQSQLLGTGFTQVVFPTEQFDLNNEYNTATSTFIPAQGGVYLVQATVALSGGGPNALRLDIFVNNNTRALEVENIFAGALMINTVTVSTILQLGAGESVNIFAVCQPSPFNTFSGLDTVHFEAARFPSP